VVGFTAFIASVVLFVAAAFGQSATNLQLVWFLIIGSAIWAAWDSTQIHLRDYKSGFSNHPIGIALGVFLIWIIAFPVYLATRYGITHGTVPRRQSASPPIGLAISSSGSTMSTSVELERLADLHQRGVLTEAEFSLAKIKLLGPAAGGI
jgi:hypothetical protein